ncbi:hypothetical protein [Gloeothece verrucosa]|uniref:Uncharacterized protein n=1 Tax=Gloeothece verrucosa (strain PCC 7822) TaxID=497965 RepID=E0UEW8_GLOV7|nr:hypothetical protein [Gloeothece verrucosa]ADN13098.1 conserved hypothetical protein [Gloeothece verrucosa PCC 7822]
MSQNPQTPSNPNFLGALAGLIGILGIFLYFTGWIYRWSYFGYFELEIISLNFPLESFLIVPIQVFFGNFITTIKALFAIIITPFLIKFTLWLLSPNSSNITFLKKLHRWIIFQKLRQIIATLFNQIFKDLIIVSWLLIVLFWLAQSQGYQDARRDALNSSSTLSVVAVVSSNEKLALGRQLDDIFADPSLKGYRIIGDQELFDKIRGRELNDTTNPNQPIVWRLLLQTDSWVYIFPALPPNSKSNQRPPVLAISTADGRIQFLILSRPKMN